jgi:hypothetical protein
MVSLVKSKIARCREFADMTAWDREVMIPLQPAAI